MAVKEKEAETYYEVTNKGSFVMLFTEGNAFLYPGARAIVENSKVNESTMNRWKDIGCEFRSISKQEGEELLGKYGILGVK